MRKVILGVILGMMLVGGGLWMRPAMAANTICDEPDSVFSKEAKEAAGCFADDKKDTTIIPVVHLIINVVLSIVGIVAVCVIVYAGVTFTTSIGDARKIYMARQTLLYGVVGLVVALLAYAIVNFVIANIMV